MTACTCITELDRLLAPKGAQVVSTIPWRPGTVRNAIVATMKRPDAKTKRGQKVPTVIADYCPFCGVKYPVAT